LSTSETANRDVKNLKRMTCLSGRISLLKACT
jgi:hypothetical protein